MNNIKFYIKLEILFYNNLKFINFYLYIKLIYRYIMHLFNFYYFKPFYLNFIDFISSQELII